MSLPQLLEFFKKDLDNDIYVAVLEEEIEIPFRLPSVKNAIRYQQLLKLSEGTSFVSIIIEYIFKQIIEDSWLMNAEEIPAGIPASIVNLALYLSGQSEDFIKNTKELINKYREESQSILKFMKRKICSVFPAYTFEACDRMDYPHLVEIFIEAEQILLENGIIKEQFQFTDGKSEKEQAIKSLHEQIRADTESYKIFNSVQQQTQMEQDFRRKQLEKAKQEEMNYRRSKHRK